MVTDNTHEAQSDLNTARIPIFQIPKNRISSKKVR